MKIVKFPHPALLKKSQPIVNFDDKLRALAQDMLSTMATSSGIGLAANQVGLNIRLFVMRCGDIATGDINNSVFINPVIVEASQEIREYQEGCLSFPSLYIPVSRPEEVRLQWKNINGEPQEAVFTELAAVCVQHEIDHLDGINYVDKLGQVKKSFALKKFYKLDKEQQKKNKESKIEEKI